MKKSVICSVLLLLGSAFSMVSVAQTEETPMETMAQDEGVETLENGWDRANKLYDEKKYDEAIEIYQSIVADGYVSDKLFYNLANAYYRQGEFGKAILFYNRTLKLNPADRDARHNLEMANTMIVDQIEQVPEFFVNMWIRSWRQSMSSNSATWYSIAMLAVLVSAVVIYLLSKNRKVRKIGFFSAIVALCFGVLFTAFAVRLKNDVSNSNEAIIMQSSVAVKSSPDRNSTELFILHEGTKVVISERLNNWREVVIADGNRGWIEGGTLEEI